MEVQDLWGGSARKQVTNLNGQQEGVTLHKQWNKSNKE